MKKMFLLFSHKLTDAQVLDAQKSHAIDEFVELPNNLKQLWGSFSPYAKSIKPSLREIIDFLDKNATKDDCVLIQGDFGATTLMVSYSLKAGLIPLYATTIRNSNDIKKDGKIIKTSIFEHVQFRKYEL